MQSLTSIPPLEIVLFCIFILYLIFPISTPPLFSPFVNSNIGMSVIIITTLYFLLYTAPILGILSVFVGYELLNRSSSVSPLKRLRNTINETIQPLSPDNHPSKKEIIPARQLSLEEEVINDKSPVGRSVSNEVYIESSFKPINDKLMGGSLV